MSLQRKESSLTQKVELTVYGTVQGVGFRPFVFRLAKELGLDGWVKNTGQGVVIELTADGQAIRQFTQALLSKKPSGAHITHIEHRPIPLTSTGQKDFFIKESDEEKVASLSLLPDTALCGLCRDELYDTSSFRYRYPFIHCCSCGPRFSLFEKMPFDRKNTTMRHFIPCSFCQKEYTDPHNRRFFSQTICCPQCGPQLSFVGPSNLILATKEDAIDAAKEKLKEGSIVAVKNTAGFLLLAHAQNDETLTRLRKGKRREKKPFALMLAGVEQGRCIAYIDDAEEQALTAWQAPIVLLKKKRKAPLSPLVCMDSPYVGIMLAHSALLLMLSEINIPLVATSGNISDQPLCVDNQEAMLELSSVADYFLLHDRPIARGLDDSITCIMDKEKVLVRRARGYVPSVLSFDLRDRDVADALAFGSELKNTFALGREGRVYVSQHMGSLSTKKSCDHYLNQMQSFSSLLHFTPAVAICDLHPDYFSSQAAHATPLPVKGIAHHRAHVYACMLDRGIFTPHTALCWDGLGLGEDGTLWGAEGFLFDGKKLTRCATFQSFALPGGYKAVKEPRRALLGLVHTLYDKQAKMGLWEQELQRLFSMQELNVLVPHLIGRNHRWLCSSMGRLFDAVAAFLGVCTINNYEGEGALCLEALCYLTDESPEGYPLGVDKQGDLIVFLLEPMLSEMLFDKRRGITPPVIARKFVKALCNSMVWLAEHNGHRHILLTGGVMQNRYLVETALPQLRRKGFIPLLHHSLPPGDGNLSAGQMVGYHLEKPRGQ